MISSKEYLMHLRELFRADMREHDYCIGEDRVEDLFRKLLGESKPESVSSSIESNLKLQEILNLELEKVSKKIPQLFERDDTFYKSIK